jgi:hypothetical protein
MAISSVKRRRVILALSASLLLVLIIAVMGLFAPPLVPRLLTEQEIQRDVLHERLQAYIRGRSRYDVFCVSIDGKDPSASFLSALQNHLPRVVKASDCGLIGPIGPVVEKQTGKSAAILTVGRVQWLTMADAEVQTSLYCGRLCGVGGVSEVTWDWKRRRWSVSNRGTWIS